VKPAWSWQFDPENLRPMGELGLPSPISREWAWEGSEGEGVKVAVIDSGIEPGHPMVGRIDGSVAVEEDPGSEEGYRTHEVPPADPFGHGTACAGIIRSIAPKAELYSVRVFGERLTGKGITVVGGLRWALDNGMQVVNMSLSSKSRQYFEVFHELADKAYFQRVMLVCAVNNAPAPSYPSEYASVFSVAAHDRSDRFRFDCNPDPPVEFGAPGIGVEVAWAGGGTVKVMGNSFAAPHIAGHAARILGKHPGLTPFQMKAILAALAENAATTP
jgi:subtilisin